MLKDIIGSSSNVEQIILEIDKLTENELLRQDNNSSLENSLIYKIIENTNINDKNRLEIIQRLITKKCFITGHDEIGYNIIYYFTCKIKFCLHDSIHEMYNILEKLLDYSNQCNLKLANAEVKKMFTSIFLAYDARNLELLKIFLKKVDSVVWVHDMTANSLLTLSLEKEDKELLNILLEKHSKNQIYISETKLLQKLLETAIISNDSSSIFYDELGKKILVTFDYTYLKELSNKYKEIVEDNKIIQSINSIISDSTEIFAELNTSVSILIESAASLVKDRYKFSKYENFNKLLEKVESSYILFDSKIDTNSMYYKNLNLSIGGLIVKGYLEVFRGYKIYIKDDFENRFKRLMKKFDRIQIFDDLKTNHNDFKKLLNISNELDELVLKFITMSFDNISDENIDRDISLIKLIDELENIKLKPQDIKIEDMSLLYYLASRSGYIDNITKMTIEDGKLSIIKSKEKIRVRLFEILVENGFKDSEIFNSDFTSSVKNTEIKKLISNLSLIHYVKNNNIEEVNKILSFESAYIYPKTIQNAIYITDKGSYTDISELLFKYIAKDLKVVVNSEEKELLKIYDYDSIKQLMLNANDNSIKEIITIADHMTSLRGPIKKIMIEYCLNPIKFLLDNNITINEIETNYKLVLSKYFEYIIVVDEYSDKNSKNVILEEFFLWLIYNENLATDIRKRICLILDEFKLSYPEKEDIFKSFVEKAKKCIDVEDFKKTCPIKYYAITGDKEKVNDSLNGYVDIQILDDEFFNNIKDNDIKVLIAKYKENPVSYWFDNIKNLLKSNLEKIAFLEDNTIENIFYWTKDKKDLDDHYRGLILKKLGLLAKNGSDIKYMIYSDKEASDSDEISEDENERELNDHVSKLNQSRLQSSNMSR